MMGRRSPRYLCAIARARFTDVIEKDDGDCLADRCSFSGSRRSFRVHRCATWAQPL